MIEQNNDIDFVTIAAFLRGLQPDPLMTVSEWADNYRFLPSESARPGKFNMNVTPYMREIANRLSPSDPAVRIIFIKSSQVGATETGNNWLGAIMHLYPAPMLYVMPTDMMMKDTSKNRIQKMIDNTPILQDKISVSRGKDSKNTILYKEFEGGFVKMVGANSPVGLSSTPVKFVYMDEIDRYPLNVSGEGSALSLAETRTLTYGGTKKIFLTSTPTIDGISAIDAEYKNTSQRHYHIPCPHCNHMQVLVFEQLRYTITGKHCTNAEYQCISCKNMIQERYKTSFMEKGQWIPENADYESIYSYGYHINALYSPYGMYSWMNMAEEYEKAKNDPPKMIAFMNTKLGETYKPKEGIRPSWESLYERSQQVDNICQTNVVMSNVVFITAGVDVQPDRLEVEIVGWMKNKESQSIDYRIIPGDTDGQDVWNELAELIKTQWKRSDDYTLPLRMMAVDSGFNTKRVYEFTNKYPAREVVPIKGRDSLDTMFSAPRTVEFTRSGKKIGTNKLYNLGVSIIKGEIYGFLKQKIDEETGEIPRGYCWFPKRNVDYFKGLTVEELCLVVNKKGAAVYQWQKKPKDRNEPLDCRVYARAAAAIVGADGWTDERWDKEFLLGAVSPIKTPVKKPERKKSKFWE